VSRSGTAIQLVTCISGLLNAVETRIIKTDDSRKPLDVD